MSDYPRTAWTFGTKCCEVRKVELVEASRFGNSEFDAKGNAYRPEELFPSARAALAGVAAYLERKEAEVARLQAVIDRQRNTWNQQLRIYE